jgi:hypothetical protein
VYIVKILIATAFFIYMELSLSTTIVRSTNHNQNLYNASTPGMGYNYSFDMGRR